MLRVMQGLIRLLILIGIISQVTCDSLHPRRPKTEDEFYRLKLAEATSTIEEMYQKMDKLYEKRKRVAWDFKNPITLEHFQKYNESRKSSNPPFHKPPNILFMLADDMGYGDTSVQPFVQDPDENWPCSEGGILTPNLERMALQGTIASNFHSASPVCSPSRVSVMTGLYPWRLGAMNAFELGKDLSQRNGFLPQIYATTAEVFRDNGYHTIHSGKWHLGGMREEFRLDRINRDVCANPSPNQHGFEEYISELDGPGRKDPHCCRMQLTDGIESPRYTFLLSNAVLHSKGHRHLLRNDIPKPKIDNPQNIQNVLSDHEVNDAIELIKQHHASGSQQPWFTQIWFNAPHGPWENLEAGQALYCEKYKKNQEYFNNFQCIKPSYEKLQNMRWWYKTMVGPFQLDRH